MSVLHTPRTHVRVLCELSQDSAETVKHLDERIAQIEEANPHTWLCTIQDEVDSINKRKGQYDQAIEEVFQTVLTEIGRLSKEVRLLSSRYSHPLCRTRERVLTYSWICT